MKSAAPSFFARALLIDISDALVPIGVVASATRRGPLAAAYITDCDRLGLPPTARTAKQIIDGWSGKEIGSLQLPDRVAGHMTLSDVVEIEHLFNPPDGIAARAFDQLVASQPPFIEQTIPCTILELDSPDDRQAACL